MAKVKVDVWCPQSKRMEKLILDCANPKGEIVSGKPVNCGSKKNCNKGEFCWLNAILLETSRRK